MKRIILVLLIVIITSSLFAVPLYINIYPKNDTKKEILLLEDVLRKNLDPDAKAYTYGENSHLIHWEYVDIDTDDYMARVFIGQALEFLEVILDAKCDWDETKDYVICSYRLKIDPYEVLANINLINYLL